MRSVEAALDGGAPLVEALVSDAASERGAALVARLAAAGVPVHVLPARDLDRVGDARSSQGVVAVARRVVAGALPASAGRVLLLDGVQDPGNVGALVRTAAWFGAEAVVADETTADFEGPKAVRAAMGGVWDVALVRVPALAPVLDALRAQGVAVWGADLGGATARAWTPGGPAALVMGSEAHGLSPDVRERLDGRVAIAAGRGGGGRGVESLNVVVAAGVLLHQWLGQSDAAA